MASQQIDRLKGLVYKVEDREKAVEQERKAKEEKDGLLKEIRRKYEELHLMVFKLLKFLFF